MLKFQIALIAILIGCVALISCEQLIGVLTPPEDDMVMPPEEMPEEMMPTEEMVAMYTSWAKVTYTAVAVGAHGEGDRAVYINDVGAMALQDGMTTYPVGTIIYKDIMDAATNTTVETTEWMEKTEDPMNAASNGWLYKGENQAACHGCHVLAGTGEKSGMDAVFTDFSSLVAEDMDDMADMAGEEMDGMDDMDDGAMDDGAMDDGAMDDGAMDDGAMDDGQ